MIDLQHAFLLGKTFGLTNMIALDTDGKQISNQQVVVYNNGAAVTINRGPINTTTCAREVIARRRRVRAIPPRL